jgi:hypothetical protein
MESPTTSEEEFHRLRSSAQDENNKTFEQRFQDIFGQQQQDQERQTAAAEEEEQDPRGGDVKEDEEEEEFIYDGQDVKLFDDEEDEDQKDYATKLDEILRSNQLRHHQQPNSAGSMDEEQADDPEGEPIILSGTKTNGQDHPVLESFIELAESDDGSVVKPPIIHPPQKPNLPILNHNHHQHQTSQSPLSPPVVIPPDVSIILHVLVPMKFN